MKIWVSRLAIAFSLLVIVSALLLYVNRSYFVQRFLGSMYEQRVSVFDQFPLAAGDVVMLGDSITQGGEWAELFPDVPIKNRGIGGDTTTGVLARLDDIVGSQPAAVFIKIGTNDLTHGPDDRQVSYRQYREIVARIRSEAPGTRIYLQSILPRAQKMRTEVEQFNREIARVAAQTGAEFIELYPHFLAADGSIEDAVTGDELHLNGPGYALWQQQLAPYMREYTNNRE